MKAFVVFSFVAFVALFAGSAKAAMSRGDRKNLAVMLAYRPHSEIQTRDRQSNKTWTYNIEDENSMENINTELLEALIKERFAKRVNPSEADHQRRTVKRENVDEDFESHESHEDIDEAKVVAIGDETSKDKKTCYKNTYKNVLNAFESALKSQIENYKKCVCKKKPASTTTTTTEASTTTSSTTEKIVARGMDDDDEDLIDDALANKDDIICFHRKYDFMLNKLLERIPCQAPPKSNDAEMEEFNGETVKRAERNNNIKKHQNDDEESESVEINVSELTPKPKTTTSKPLKARKSDDSNDKLNEQILTILKEHLKLKKPQKPLKKKQTSPKKITIKSRSLPQVEETDESNEPELDESSHQQFMKQLQELFEKYQVDPDGTFPMQSEEHSADSEPTVPSRKLSKKSTTRGTVDESSDESTEAVVKLKARKAEKKHHKLGDDSGKASKSHNVINHNNVAANNPKKSYRSSARVDDASDDSSEESIVSRSHNNAKKSHRASNSSTEKTASSNGNNNAKKSNRNGKNARTSSDDRIAADFAKKVSDFARGKPTKSN